MSYTGSPLAYSQKSSQKNADLFNAVFTPTSSDNRVKSTERVRAREAQDVKIKDLEEKLENALKNQSPYIQGLEKTIKEYEALNTDQIDFKNKMEIIEKERFEKNGMLININEQLKVKDEECINLQNTIATVQTRLTELENEHKITQGALELSKAVNVKLKEKEKELKNQLNNIPSNSKEVRHPTSDDLTKILTNLVPFIKKVNDLEKEINELRDEAQKTCKIINKGTATSNILEVALAWLDPVESPKDTVESQKDTKEKPCRKPNYSELCIKYEILRPEFLKVREHLENSINQAKYEFVPEKQIEAISAKNNLSMRVMKENDNKFEELFKICGETLIKLDNEFDHLSERYDNATDHLNKIDHNLALLSSNSYMSNICGKIMGYQVIKRISPTSSSYVSKIKKEEEEERKELIIESKESTSTT